ncbi:uncharacterized protein P884DRAFT_274880 [Thermothelomyces heterothallicus CBS 202.75]|uniref:uncharacterized protein n=1 Tax=Thermothelomyces heterothallicus CBS 202.75 TaxID=1149848 RepID=UPI0037438605
MISRKPTLPPSPHLPRQGVLTGRINRNNEEGSSDGESPYEQNQHRMVAATTRAEGAGADPPVPGRPRGRTNRGGGKYGRCPRCGTGRRVRSRFNPYGQSVHKGKFRFVCSDRANHGCGYSEVLESDPALDPESYLQNAVAPPQAAPSSASAALRNRRQGQKQGRTRGSSASGSGGVNLDASRDGIGRGTVSCGNGKYDIEYEEERSEEENENEEDPEPVRRRPPTTASQAFSNRANDDRGAGRDTPQQRLGCPQCMQGRLFKKYKNVAPFTEAVLVREKIRNGKNAMGGCGYKVDIGAEPADDGDANAGAAITADEQGKGERAANARAQIRQIKKNSARQFARERKEKEKFIMEERARAVADPNAAAVMATPDPKTKRKKILVDLTSDDELLRPARPELAGEAVGPYAPIFIVSSDDEAAPPVKPARRPIRTAEVTIGSLQGPEATAPDDFDSVDEAELTRLAELAEQAGRADHRTDDNSRTEKEKEGEKTCGDNETDMMLLTGRLASERTQRGQSAAARAARIRTTSRDSM